MPIVRSTLRGPRALHLAFLVTLAACATTSSPAPPPAPPAGAVEAFARARSLRDAGADAREPRIWEALGEARRLALAAGLKAAGSSTALCLLDQPGAGLSEQDLEALMATLRRKADRGTLFLVTAHRSTVRAMASMTLQLR